MSEIVVVRHGETEWSETGQHTSLTDLPMTETGRERARQLAPRLAQRSFALVLCSPLRRARETCQLAGFGEVAVISNDLREWEYGEYEGLTTPQIREVRRGWDLWRDGCPGGESPEQVGFRADRVLGVMRAAEGDALAFGHGHIGRVIGARWVAQPVAFGARLAYSTGAISTLGFERDRELLTDWNRR
jgi:broad specificity phosphatase PhoE